jgi:uncharacterized protein (UPF0333 family)
MKDEFAFLRPVILLSASILVFSVFGRVFHEAGEQRARTVEAMRAATNTAFARAASTNGKALAASSHPKICSESQSSNTDCPLIH